MLLLFNFTVALLLIRKIWMINLPVRWEMGDFKKCGRKGAKDPKIEGNDFEMGWGIDTPLRTMICRVIFDLLM